MFLKGEREWLSEIVGDLTDLNRMLVYADWLQEHGAGKRAAFLRKYVDAIQSMDPADLPRPTGVPEAWLQLIGYRIVFALAGWSYPSTKTPLLKLARPALRMVKKNTTDGRIPVGASKIGGLPDLPKGFAWPPGGDCHAIYNDDTGGTDRLAGFLAQVNLAEIADTQAARVLPDSGLLSFFCFQDIENDNPDSIGAKAVYFPGDAKLVRMKPPKELTVGNGVIPAQRLRFEEILDLPADSDGPWRDDLESPEAEQLADALVYPRNINFENMLGYARATTGSDPTPDKKHRHLIVLKNVSGCQLHIQIHEKDLAARDFDKIKLVWVDFD
jgi:uncharacterized protein (TIGR02996 family)